MSGSAHASFWANDRAASAAALRRAWRCSQADPSGRSAESEQERQPEVGGGLSINTNEEDKRIFFIETKSGHGWASREFRGPGDETSASRRQELNPKSQKFAMGAYVRHRCEEDIPRACSGRRKTLFVGWLLCTLSVIRHPSNPPLASVRALYLC